MKNLLILGAGTAGTMMAHHLRKTINRAEWNLQIVDPEPDHYYQPGYLFLPFGLYSEKDVARPKRRFLPREVEYVPGRVERIDAEKNEVRLSNGVPLRYDLLVIATGVHPVPEQTEGLRREDWGKRIFEFYTFAGARALAEKLRAWPGGRLVIHICEMPIKCPVAPLEFAFLAESWLAERGLREKTELIYVTPLSGAFTKPIAAGVLGHLLEAKRIQAVNDFNIARVDPDRHRIISWDEKEVPYDLLVTVPTNMGDPMIERSGLGDELNLVPTDKHTLQSKARPNIFALGDATDLPISKAGSVAHFQAEILTENIRHYLRGEPLGARFDGHSNCFLESGHGKAVLLDFNYELEPVPGKFPLAGLGPLTLLAETRVNHWAKLASKWLYWHRLLQGRPIPFVTSRMSLAGKQVPAGAAKAEDVDALKG